MPCGGATALGCKLQDKQMGRDWQSSRSCPTCWSPATSRLRRAYSFGRGCLIFAQRSSKMNSLKVGLFSL